MSQDPIFSYDAWSRNLPDLTQLYRYSVPYPHIVLDDFMNPSVLRSAASEFESPEKDWVHYIHLNEKKRGRSEYAGFGSALKSIVDEFGSGRFLMFLETITGLEGLFLDNELVGGGLHLTARGGFLNIHTDFSSHPHHPDWQRTLNLIIYLNDDWEEQYGGGLELWAGTIKKCVKKIAPIFNRAVLFYTGEKSFHGHPDPLNCPEGLMRKSIALYYYRTVSRHNRTTSTRYYSRPQDSWAHRFFIAVDNALLVLYHHLRMRLKFSDRLGSRILTIFKFK